MSNVLTNVGRNIITGRIKGVVSGVGSAEPKYLSIGTGAGTSAVTDTALFTEFGGSRVAGTSVQATTTVTNDTYSVTGTLTMGSTTAVTNAGAFDATSAGNLLCKGDFSVVNLNAGDSIALTISVQFL